MDREELHVTAQLARLELSREEEDRLEKAVFQMLEHFAKMKELDVEAWSPPPSWPRTTACVRTWPRSAVSLSAAPNPS